MSGKTYNKDLVFVILNYNIVNETRECIKTIFTNLDTKEVHVLVVDNCSSNGAGKKLAEIYKNHQKVSVILNQENSGFARGNNIGIREALKMNPKYICCINNDTLIPKQKFFSLIDKEYERYHPAIIGPKIVLKDGTINRLNRYLHTIENYEEMIRKRQRALNTNDFSRGVESKNPIKKAIRKLPGSFQYNYHAMREILKGNFYCGKSRNVILHGCCYIFTPAFFEKLDGFYDRTFMFGEEEHLYLSLLENGLTDVYLPSIKIRHLEDASTDATFAQEEEKTRFFYKNSIDSFNLLIERMKKDEDIIPGYYIDKKEQKLSWLQHRRNRNR